MAERGYQHLVDDFFINGVRQPIVPDEAVLLPLSNLKADTSATTVYDLAGADYGTFEGPVELYVWRQADGSELEYVTVAGTSVVSPTALSRKVDALMVAVAPGVAA